MLKETCGYEEPYSPSIILPETPGGYEIHIPLFSGRRFYLVDRKQGIWLLNFKLPNFIWSTGSKVV